MTLNSKLRKITCGPIHFSRYFLNSRHFKPLETLCLPTGFTNSASQVLVGALTAHPNIAMSNQVDLMESWWHNLHTYGESIAWKMLLLDIRALEKKMDSDQIANVKRKHRIYYIPEQYQGRSEKLTVIGDCSLEVNMKILMKKVYRGKEGECMGLATLQGSTEIPLKIILIVRNPYDWIGSKTVRSYWKKEQKEIMAIMVNRFIKTCERCKILLDHLSEDQVYIWHFEGHIADPRRKLSELCRFLGVETIESYLDACAGIFSENLNYNRNKIDWPEQHKERVSAAIEQYSFLSGYTWDS